MTTSKKATLTGGSSIGPVNFTFASGVYSATINVISPANQLAYTFQISS
jgi:hypothetical protein